MISLAKTPSPEDIEYYYKKNRFFTLLKTSGKWKDLFWAKEALFALLLTIISTVIVGQIFISLPVKEFCNLIGTTLLALSTGLITMLGFVISGLAIISGTLSNKMLTTINDKGKFRNIINIVFTFYFDGALIGVTLVQFLLLYLSLYTNWIITIGKVYAFSIVFGYFFWFTIIYSIMLLGTSLRLLILGHFFGSAADKSNK